MSNISLRYPLINRIFLKANNLASYYIFKKNRRLEIGSRIVSLCFDDFPKSAFINGAKLLNKYTVKGTFYTSFSFFDKFQKVQEMGTYRDIEYLLNDGHEIGCHTFSHLDCPFHTIKEILIDCKKNQKTAEKKFGIVLKSFAYPKGNISPFIKKALAKEYDTCRTIRRGINIDSIDTASLRSIPLYRRYDMEGYANFFNILKERGGWLILYTHDVSKNPSEYGCTMDMIEKVIVENIKNDIQILTIAEANKKFIKDTVTQ